MARRGVAGVGGEDVRGDLLAAVEEESGAGFSVEVASKVELYYGEAIRRQATEVLVGLGLAGARVTIHDGGALPFVIGARVETAARRAGLTVPPHPIAAPPPSRPASPRDRLRRSRLYLPGNFPRYMVNAGLHGPDGVILDLEDSVHPLEKDAARVLVRNAVREVDFGRAEVMVRINQLPAGLADLREVLPAGPDLILIPKVEDPAQVAEVDRVITEISTELEWNRPLHVMPILESALGVERAYEIGRASPRVVALTLGLEDLTADLGVPKTVEGDETLYARLRTVNAARAAGLQAIDSVFGDVGDMEGLERWCRRSRAMGFEGMGCIHPRQVPVIHASFAPSEAEIAKARRIVEAFRAAETKGLGVVSLGSKMIDPPVVNRALKLVDQARAMGLLDEEESPR
ncbi:MAG: aldolase/citrate lyase family protein [Planctomycetota bacterium]